MRSGTSGPLADSELELDEARRRVQLPALERDGLLRMYGTPAAWPE